MLPVVPLLAFGQSNQAFGFTAVAATNKRREHPHVDNAKCCAMFVACCAFVERIKLDEIVVMNYGWFWGCVGVGAVLCSV